MKLETKMHKFILATAFTLVLQSVAQGQDSCAQTFNVNPNKNVSFLNLGSGAGESVSVTMTCTAAEQMRENMFLSGEAIQPSLMDNASALRAKMHEINQQLAGKRDALAAATNKAQRQLVFTTLGGFGLAGGVAFGTAGCIAGGIPACVATFSAAVALVKLADAASTSAGDLANEANAARNEIIRLLEKSQAMEAQITQAMVAQYKLRYNSTYNALCTAIRQQCIP
jgi:hypothetical protein